MLVARRPGIQAESGPLVWSKVPEFSMAYVGSSAVIPYVEFYLNKTMRRVMSEHCANDPRLKADLETFIDQETQHAKYHHRFNKRLFTEIPALKALTAELAETLEAMFKTRSLAFNAGYCEGFECIATYDAIYLHENCDEYFEGADPDGANLILWHVTEEFEHRAVCHDAFKKVTRNYFMRVWMTLYTAIHLTKFFNRAQSIVHEHFTKNLSAQEKEESKRRMKRLARRRVFFLLPRVWRVLLPGYSPDELSIPPRIRSAMEFFKNEQPITEVFRQPSDRPNCVSG
jgi:uncharacterized protein